jgi:signal transduction histidine kinase
MVDYAGQLPEAGQRDLQIIRDGAQKMAALIRDLLMLSRTGRQPLTRQKLDMTGLVQSVWQTVHAQAPERHVEFICDDLPAAEGDEALVRQVWFNLVDNAFKYTRHQEHTRIEISARKEDDGLTFTVRDNGAGFDMRYVHKLFGVFQRLHRVEDYDGTGIGLALVQRIVQRHGGRVWAEGETGRGAVFSFWLPEEKT